MAGTSHSSASAYATSHLSLSLLALLSSSGFSKSSSSAANILAEVLQRYIQLIGSTCVQHANHGGRNVVAPQDLRAALEHILGGDPVEEVLQWAEDEGRIDMSEEYSEDVEAERSQPNGTLKEANDPLHHPTRGRDLLSRLSIGRPQPFLGESCEMHYCPIPAQQYRELALDHVRREVKINELVWNGKLPRYTFKLNGKARRADPNAMDVDAESDDSIFSSFQDGLRTDTEASLAATHVSMGRLSSPSSGRKRRRATEKVRRFGSLEVDYVPSYLPPFPAANDEQPSASIESPKEEQDEAIFSPLETDLEHIQDEKRRIHAAQQAAAQCLIEENPTGEPKKEQTAEERAAQAEKAFQALQARRILRDCWKEAIPFESSTLAATYPASELTNLDKAIAESSWKGMVTIAPATSSIRAFAADYGALVEDPSTSGAAEIYLTQPGGAYQDAVSKRRRLAHGISDPARYAPNDSLYGSVCARPAVLPFQPGPSWLVATLPPPTLYENDAAVAAALSAPILTPVLPNGRPAALIPPSGSLVPTLAYRHPTHLSIGARIVASGDLLKRISRYSDPPPLLDEKHAERFFHGLPASRDLLGGSSDLSRNRATGSGSSNSSLRSALEKLILQLKEKEAQVLPEEDKEELQRRQQELQLQLQAAEEKKTEVSMGDSYAARIRNGSITMVHTWDWGGRDPYDAGLPGRKVGKDGGESRPVALVAVAK